MTTFATGLKITNAISGSASTGGSAVAVYTCPAGKVARLQVTGWTNSSNGTLSFTNSTTPTVRVVIGQNSQVSDGPNMAGMNFIHMVEGQTLYLVGQSITYYVEEFNKP